MAQRQRCRIVGCVRWQFEGSLYCRTCHKHAEEEEARQKADPVDAPPVPVEKPSQREAFYHNQYFDIMWDGS